MSAQGCNLGHYHVRLRLCNLHRLHLPHLGISHQELSSPKYKLQLPNESFLANKMTCKACESLTIDKLFERAHTPPGHLILHSHYDLLNEAASNGCFTCQIFQNCFSSNYGDLNKKLAQIQKSSDAAPPVVVILQMAFPQNGKRPISKLHVQIGDEPDRPGVEQLKISFRISKSSSTRQIASL